LKLLDESQLLNEDYRRFVLEQFDEKNNVDRRKESLMRHEVYDGHSKKWVIEKLAEEKLLPETVARMSNRASGVPFMRKVTNKNAKSYTGGVDRTVSDDEQSQTAIQALADEMDVNSVMDRADKYSHFAKNTLVAVRPKLISYDKEGFKRYRISTDALPSYTYDVIEDFSNPGEALAVVLSDFEAETAETKYPLPGEHTRYPADKVHSISGPKVEKDNRHFIWWSDNYHFTTNSKGQYLSLADEQGERKNPIGLLPFITIAMDQMGQYWSKGGTDLIDGDILLNKLITDRNTIAYVQGWGQLVISGKGLPAVMQGGPDKAFIFEVKEGDPTPGVFYANASPDLGGWENMINQTVALYLSSNNLSPRNIAAKLDANNMASGIAMLIEQSESMDDLKDKQRVFQDKEPIFWEVVKRWQSLYFELGLLVDDFKEIGTFESSDVKLKFLREKQVITEKEKLEIIKIRKDLGLNTMMDLLKIDNPDLDDDDAQTLMDKITKEKEERAAKFGLPMAKPAVVSHEDIDDEDDEDDEEGDDE